MKAGDFEGITKKTEEVIWWIKEARGTPLFLGIENVGIPPGHFTGDDNALWYSETFGFKIEDEGYAPFFISDKEREGIEAVDKSKQIRYQVAIQVANFEEACKYLENKEIELEEPKINKNMKFVFLKNPDPAGNRVCLFYRV